MRKIGKLKSVLALTIMTTVCSITPSITALGVQYTTTSDEELRIAAAKSQFLQNSKAMAATNWEKLQNRKMEEKAASENSQIVADEMAVISAEEEKNSVKKEAILSIKKSVKTAEKEATNVAKGVAKIAQVAKKQTQTKKKGSGSVSRYVIGSKGSSAFKSFEYHTDTDGNSSFRKGSAQRALQGKAYTGNYGIRMVDGRYCVAVGSRFGKMIGTKIDVKLANGNVIECILGDQKADSDTDSTNSYHLGDGSYLEFIVDRKAFNSNAKRRGNVGVIKEFSGKIKEIIVYRKG